MKELPYANAAYNYNFKPGEAGKLILEFWITPFDYAGCEGPQRAVESVLTENKLIGLAWAVMDYDDVNSNAHTFWNLSRKHTMYGKADELVAFRLMPLEPQFQKAIDAQWSFKILDMNRRLVAFEDLSVGKITSWKWDFGDGTTSTEQHPIHAYQKAGQYVVVLNIEGPAGSLAAVEDLGRGGAVKRFRAVLLLLAGGVAAAQIPSPGDELNKVLGQKTGGRFRLIFEFRVRDESRIGQQLRAGQESR